MSAPEFDAIFGRVKDEGLAYGSGTRSSDDMAINHHRGRRGFYFEDPTDHLLEVLNCLSINARPGPARAGHQYRPSLNSEPNPCSSDPRSPTPAVYAGLSWHLAPCRRVRVAGATAAVPTTAVRSSRHPELQSLLLCVAISPAAQKGPPWTGCVGLPWNLALTFEFRLCAARGIGTEEQIPERPPQQIRDPSSRQMVRAIMDHMAALAEAFQVALTVVARIMIEMRRRQDDAGLAEPHRLLDVRPSR